MRAAICTAMPCTSPSTISTSPVCSPTRIDRPRSSTASRIAHAHSIARAGPSNVASAPSPVNFTTSPRQLVTCRSMMRSWAARAFVHASSPSCAARSVDPTMSVNNTVDSTRFDGLRAACAGEERLDLVEHAVGIAGEPHVVVAIELDQLRVRDPLGEICDMVTRHIAVAAPAQHQRRRLDAPEQRAHVGTRRTARTSASSSRGHRRGVHRAPTIAVWRHHPPNSAPTVDHRAGPHDFSNRSRIPRSTVARAVRRMVGGAHEPRVWAPQHERAHALRDGWRPTCMAGSACSRHREDRCAVAPDRVEHRDSRPSVQDCNRWMCLDRQSASELPRPRQSVKISRLKDASRRR